LTGFAGEKQGGTGGKWQTPHQQVKAALRGTGRLEPGDVGIWATCARRMEARATEELKILFEDARPKYLMCHPWLILHSVLRSFMV
jgi:tRNA acetyltransferase TAN1